MSLTFRCNRTLLGILLGFLTASCTRTPHPILVAIRSVEDSVVLQQSAEKTSFTVTAIVRNMDARPVHVLQCGTEAQRQIDRAWVTVFVPVCALAGSSMVAPGDSLVLPVEVFGFSASNAAPHLDPRMTAGRYRLRFGIVADEPSGPQRASPVRPVASLPFTVID
jgi:hypothetical protein